MAERVGRIGTSSAERSAAEKGWSPNAVCRRFFERLNASSFSWAVLRDGEDLPGQMGNDVDLLVAPGSLDSATHVLRAASEAAGWSLAGAQHRLGYRCFLLRRDDEFLQFDLFDDLLLGWGRLASSAVAIAARDRIACGIWCVDRGPSEAVRLVKETARHGRLAERHRAGVRDAARGEKSAFVDVLRPCGEKLAEELRRVAANEDWHELASLRKELRRQVLRPNGVQGVVMGARWGKALVGSIRRRELSSLVVVLGPDGTGKTSVVEKVAELGPAPFRRVRHETFGFGILPQLKRLKQLPYACLAMVAGGSAGRTSGAEEAPTSAGGLHSGMIGEPEWTGKLMIQATYYAVDFALGAVKLWRWRSCGEVVFFARYFDDYYFQRGFKRVPSWFLDCVGMLVPRPDVLVFLDRSAQAIYEQKPELSVEEIERQQSILRERVGRRRGEYRVDASAGLAATAAAVAELVRRDLAKRSFW